jgi:hypothetical protein
MGMSRPAAASTSSISNDLVSSRAPSSALILIKRDLTNSPDPAQAVKGRPKPSASKWKWMMNDETDGNFFQGKLSSKGQRGLLRVRFFFTPTQFFPLKRSLFTQNICQKRTKTDEISYFIAHKTSFHFFSVYKRHICIPATSFPRRGLQTAHMYSCDVVSEVPVIIRVTSFPRCGFRSAHYHSWDVIPVMWFQNCTSALIAYTCDVPNFVNFPHTFHTPSPRKLPRCWPRASQSRGIRATWSSFFARR